MFVIPAEKQVVASADPAPYKYVAQLPLDSQLSKQTGQITRKRDPNYCLHAASAMCDNCMPLEPWDKAYLTNNKIKHLSFHSYLRQLKTSQKTCLPTDPLFIPPLDEPSYTLKSCSSHLPYPQGICSKCQIGAITLAPQTYRMVDHVEFESPDIIDTFINAWRANGHQRLGFLYGMYVAYPDVPLGVKAVVQAIYEPPQEASREHIQIQAADPIAEDPAVASLAGLLGMQRVGIIYTDLTDSGTGDGKVVYKRHIDSHFLSSAETLSSAMFQLNARVPTPYSSTGAFDSRFVTCVVTANAQNEIDLFTYQASNQCCQMAAAKLIHATVDPCKFRVKKQVDNPQVYIPQVFYTQKNSFGIAVQHDANPAFPVEYMLVNVIFLDIADARVPVDTNSKVYD